MDKEIKELDLIIIGGGPAGLTAAIYAGRAKLNTLLLEDKVLGGQVRNSYTIENYPGFKNIQGSELSDLLQSQAEESGVAIDEFDIIENIILSNDEKIVETEMYLYKPKAVIVATGASPKKLPISDESKFLGNGIHYCAVCDGALYEGKKVAVVGGGNSALEEAVFLTKFAEKVYIIRRHDYFKGEKTKIEAVFNHPKIEVMLNEDLIALQGESMLEGITLRNNKTDKVTYMNMDAVFVYIGTEPKTDLIKDYIKLNRYGYIVTDENMQTNIKGVYAAGDVREKEFRQITTAIADGTIALLSAEKYILDKER